MGIVQVSLRQVVSELASSFQSIDLRAAAIKPNSSWSSVLMGIRLSSRPTEVVEQRHRELTKKFGEGKIETFKILLQAFPFSDMGKIMQQIRDARVELAGESLLLQTGGMTADSLRGVLNPISDYVRPWGTEIWPAVLYANDQRSYNYNAAQLTGVIRTKLGWPSLEDLLSAFLEIKADSSRNHDVFIHVEMPARIREIKFIAESVEVTVEAEKELNSYHVFVSKEDSKHVPQYHKQIDLEKIGEELNFILLRGRTTFENVTKDDILSCVITHDNGLELDEKSGFLRDFMPLSEINPLLACLKISGTWRRCINAPSGLMKREERKSHKMHFRSQSQRS